MRNARQQLGLTSKPGAAKIGVLSLGNRQNLHADKSFQSLLPCQIDLTHSPLPEKPEHLVARDPGNIPYGGSMFR